MTTLKEKIEVMTAAAEGKAIEYSIRGINSDWYHIGVPHWDWVGRDYRVKKEVQEYAIALDRYGQPVGVGLGSEGSCIPVASSSALIGSRIIRVREVE